jgi:hypothetical protein
VSSDESSQSDFFNLLFGRPSRKPRPRPAPELPPREERVRVRAYHLWEAAGRPEGRDREFHEQAELETPP